MHRQSIPGPLPAGTGAPIAAAHAVAVPRGRHECRARASPIAGAAARVHGRPGPARIPCQGAGPEDRATASWGRLQRRWVHPNANPVKNCSTVLICVPLKIFKIVYVCRSILKIIYSAQSWVPPSLVSENESRSGHRWRSTGDHQQCERSTITVVVRSPFPNAALEPNPLLPVVGPESGNPIDSGSTVAYRLSCSAVSWVRGVVDRNEMRTATTVGPAIGGWTLVLDGRSRPRLVSPDIPTDLTLSETDVVEM